MEFFIQQLINGLTLGGIYALIALGYTMVYGIIQLINFAHGEFFAAGGYIGVILLSFLAARGYLETHPWLCLGGAMVLAMIYCAFLAMAVEKVAYTRLRFSSRLSALVSALGMSIFLSNGLMLTQGVYDKAYPSSFAQGGFDFGMVTISYLQIIIFLPSIHLEERWQYIDQVHTVPHPHAVRMQCRVVEDQRHAYIFFITEYLMPEFHVFTKSFSMVTDNNYDGGRQ